MRFQHTVDPAALATVDGMVNRLCGSIDRVTAAVSNAVRMFRAGEIKLTWGVKEDAES